MARSQKIPALSIIIPTLNEADHLPLLLADLNEWPYDFELIIVDGGSMDLSPWLDYKRFRLSASSYQL